MVTEGVAAVPGISRVPGTWAGLRCAAQPEPRSTGVAVLWIIRSYSHQLRTHPKCAAAGGAPHGARAPAGAAAARGRRRLGGAPGGGGPARLRRRVGAGGAGRPAAGGQSRSALSLSALSQEERRVSQWQRQALEDPLCGCVAGLGSVGAQHCRVVRPCFALGGRPLATAPTVATVATLFLRPHDR